MQTEKWLYVLNIGVHLSSPNAISHLGTDSKHKVKKDKKLLEELKIFRIRIFFFSFFSSFFVNLHESNHLPDLLPCFTKDRRTYKRDTTPSKNFL